MYFLVFEHAPNILSSSLSPVVTVVSLLLPSHGSSSCCFQLNSLLSSHSSLAERCAITIEEQSISCYLIEVTASLASHPRLICRSLGIGISTSSDPLCLLPTDCHNVLATASSPSLELLAKCDLDSFSSLPLSLTSPQQDQLRLLAQVSNTFISAMYLLHILELQASCYFHCCQVHLLYWQLHPIWCSLVLFLACVAIIAGVHHWRKRTTTSLKASHTLHALIV